MEIGIYNNIKGIGQKETGHRPLLIKGRLYSQRQGLDFNQELEDTAAQP